MPEHVPFWFALIVMITTIVVVAILARAWVVTRQTGAELAFKSQMVQRGLPVEDIERLVAASSRPPHRMQPAGGSSLDADSLNEVVSVLGQVGAPPAIIAEVISAFNSLDATMQAVVSAAVQHLVASADAADGEHILAVVRPLCQPIAAAPAPIRDERMKREV